MILLLIVFILYMAYVIHTTRLKLIDLLLHDKVNDALDILTLSLTDIPGVNRDKGVEMTRMNHKHGEDEYAARHGVTKKVE